jgi:hypothetical protein
MRCAKLGNRFMLEESSAVELAGSMVCHKDGGRSGLDRIGQQAAQTPTLAMELVLLLG